MKTFYVTFCFLLISCFLISCNYSLPDGFAKMEEGREKDSIQYLCTYGLTYGTLLYVTDTLLMSREYGNKNINKVARHAHRAPKSKITFWDIVTGILTTPKAQWQYAVYEGDSVARDKKGNIIWKSISGKTDSIEQETNLFFALKGDRILIDDIRTSGNTTWIGVRYNHSGAETYAWTYLKQLTKNNAPIAPDRWTRYVVPRWDSLTVIIVIVSYIIAFVVFSIFFLKKLRLPVQSSNLSAILEIGLYCFIGFTCLFCFILMFNNETMSHYYLVPDLLDWSGQPLLINLLNISILGTVTIFTLLALTDFIMHKPKDALKCVLWRFAVILLVLSICVLAFYAIWLVVIVIVFCSMFGAALGVGQGPGYDEVHYSDGSSEKLESDGRGLFGERHYKGKKSGRKFKERLG